MRFSAPSCTRNSNKSRRCSIRQLAQADTPFVQLKGARQWQVDIFQCDLTLPSIDYRMFMTMFLTFRTSKGRSKVAIA